ncbi:hypothetical protein CDD82_1080 [Ophiocordyceps australis]|uniref:Phosducin domain-containing protein n=1 Tax=Ophiocordyceps australis TaxID=1399860 RepID=A0A2C5ZTT9_9HYPO|nr:hypothetical protein CDD82_1080 [Ophiocordyceps australis]
MATTAQQEFNHLVAANTCCHRDSQRRLDDKDKDGDNLTSDNDSDDQEAAYHRAQIDAAMRSTPGDSTPELKLPPSSFDNGRATGVKGVIADARAFQTARRSRWRDRARSARRSIFGLGGTLNNGSRSESETDDEACGSVSPHGDPALASSNQDSDEEAFMHQWREARRRELESEESRPVRSRRTSPSVRTYGFLDEVDALGYLDAIEKVTRETKVVVFVYDDACDVSATLESALIPLVKQHPTIHFVKVHFDEIEFDPAAVPSILAYQNQGDLMANLTGLIELMPDEAHYTQDSLSRLLRKHNVL